MGSDEFQAPVVQEICDPHLGGDLGRMGAATGRSGFRGHQDPARQTSLVGDERAKAMREGSAVDEKRWRRDPERAVASEAASERLTIKSEALKTAYRRDSLVVVVLPALGFVGALAWAFAYGLNWMDAGLFVAMYVVASAGIDVGYHRYFAHRAFETNAVMRVYWAITGSLAAQGRVTRWVSNHRRHHAYSDQAEDPHSPHAGFPPSMGKAGELAQLPRLHLPHLGVPLLRCDEQPAGSDCGARGAGDLGGRTVL